MNDTDRLLAALVAQQRQILDRLDELADGLVEDRALIDRLRSHVEASAPRLPQNLREVALRREIANAMAGQKFRPADAFKHPALRHVLDEMGIDTPVQLGKRLSRWSLAPESGVEKVGRSAYRVSGVSGDLST